MKIYINLIGHLNKYMPSIVTGKNAPLQVKDGCTVKELVAELGIPIDLPKIISVNETLVKSDHVIKDADQVKIIPPVGGG
ncbi:MAG: MoaD/ThiS family protein [Deltaproteobacteria bacterium]|nr:MoaD/ThiS family protein [Deltaproteobacteria bacterium]